MVAAIPPRRPVLSESLGGVRDYRDTSLIRIPLLVGSYSSPVFSDLC
jgi:hypothetical protein